MVTQMVRVTDHFEFTKEINKKPAASQQNRCLVDTGWQLPPKIRKRNSKRKSDVYRGQTPLYYSSL